MKSIRKITTLLSFLGVSLLGVIVCSTTYLVAKQVLNENFEQDLFIEFQQISAVSRVWADKDFYVDIDFDVATQFNNGGSRLFQVWSAGEELGEYLEVIDRSPMLEELEIELPHPVENIKLSPHFYDLTFPNGLPARGIFVRTKTQWALDETDNIEEYDIEIDIVVARERVSLDASINMLFKWMLIIGALVPILSFLIVYYAIGFGMAPLKAFAYKISNIKKSSEQVPLDKQWPEEVLPVVNSFNQLLARLENGIQRERRFTGDLAHEMRTPLAELRIVTDVALRAENHERLITAVQQVNVLSHSIAELVNGMLLLTRVQSGQNNLMLTLVDISSLFNLQYEVRQKRAVQRSLTITETIPDKLFVKTDLVLLSTIFSNLVNNAIEHAPEHSNIDLSLKSSGSGFVMAVRNLAPDLNDADLEHLNEPFWCKDQSRHSGKHFGLGLAIVEESVACLNLKFNVTLSTDKYITFTCQSTS